MKVVDYEIGSPNEISVSQNKNWSKQLIWQNFKTHPRPNLAALARLEKDNDYEYTDKIGNILQELVLETQMGRLVSYIDEVEEAVKKNALHCVLLSYEYQASRDFQKNIQLGGFEQNLDFSENGLLKNARQVHSEYFNGIQ